LTQGPTADTDEILEGLWRFEAIHPEWTEDEGGEDGWEPSVAWWAVDSPRGLVLIDPLVTDWAALDHLVQAHGGCGGIVRTCHWHQRSVAEAAARYGTEVWAEPPPDGPPRHPLDHALRDGDEALDQLVIRDVQRNDELALWLPKQAALLFGDAMLRRASGQLRMCPDSWLQPPGGPARLQAILGQLAELPIEHVLVSHGPLVLGDGLASLQSAIS
jgi:hypothetical protein